MRSCQRSGKKRLQRSSTGIFVAEELGRCVQEVGRNPQLVRLETVHVRVLFHLLSEFGEDFVIDSDRGWCERRRTPVIYSVHAIHVLNIALVRTLRAGGWRVTRPACCSNAFASCSLTLLREQTIAEVERTKRIFNYNPESLALLGRWRKTLQYVWDNVKQLGRHQHEILAWNVQNTAMI